jgi:hypothetical protein
MVECELSDGWSTQLANVYSRDGINSDRFIIAQKKVLLSLEHSVKGM